MIGRIIGGVIGGAMGRQNRNHPIAGAVIGAGAMFVARRVFPARYAALAATAAAAYVSKRWADRHLNDPVAPTGPNTPQAPHVATPPAAGTPVMPPASPII